MCFSSYEFIVFAKILTTLSDRRNVLLMVTNKVIVYNLMKQWALLGMLFIF